MKKHLLLFAMILLPLVASAHDMERRDRYLFQTKAIQRVANSRESAYSVDPIQFEIPNKFTLSWSHYLVLMRIKKEEERQFYEIECQKQDWSVRQLSRQVGSSLYERLALSRNKDEVMRLAKEGQTIEKSQDIIKDPLTLEFLGLKPRHRGSLVILKGLI